MKRIIENIIRIRKPNFRFDQHVTSAMLFDLALEKTISLLRGTLVFLLHFKKPNVVFLGKNVQFFNIRNIHIGKLTKIDRGVYLSGLGKGKLEIGNSSSIGAYCQIIVSTSFNNIGEYIKIGNHVGIGQFASLGGSGGLEIGDHCIIGQYFSCHPENHNFDGLNKLIKDQGTSRAAIKIGQDCWIGAKVTVLAGVEIGAHSVIAAGSVVTKSVPEYSVVAGVPARVLKNRKTQLS
jgi:acetyltransferase-like isoleucine patch superfamily enzyme